MIWGLFSLYGLFYALTEGAAKALVAELVSEKDRGKAYGLYNAAIGVMAAGQFDRGRPLDAPYTGSTLCFWGGVSTYCTHRFAIRPSIRSHEARR